MRFWLQAITFETAQKHKIADLTKANRRNFHIRFIVDSTKIDKNILTRLCLYVNNRKTVCSLYFDLHLIKT